MDELDKLSPEEILNLFESDTKEIRYHRSKILQDYIKKLDLVKDKVKIEKIKKEILVHDLHISFDDRTIRFHSMFSFKTKDGGKIDYPDLKTDFPEDSVKYYKDRVNSTKNPILLSRYCDFLWFHKNGFEYAKKAIEAYLECTDIYLRNNWYMEMTDSLLRALEISNSINNDELRDKSISKFLDVITKLRQNKNYRFLIELINALIPTKKVDLNDFIGIMEEAVTYYQNNQDDGLHMQRGFLEVLVELYKKIDSTKKEIIDLRIVDTFVKEAEWKKTHYPKGDLVASSIYQEALKRYYDLGKTEEAEKIKLIIQELNNSNKDKFKAIVTEVSIPNKDIESYISNFKDKPTRKVIELISTEKQLIPDYQKSQESALEQAKEFPLQHLMPVSIVRDNLQLKIIREEKDKLEFYSIRNFQIAYKITASLLLHKIFEVIESKPDFIDELVKFISDCQYIKKTRIPFILSGLSHYKNKDYLASMHILLFQIEGILRDMMEAMKISAFSYQDNENKARLLRSIIETLYSVEGIDKNLIKFIEVFLNKIEGDNLRNNIGHSLSDISQFSKENNLLIILIILHLCAYKIIEI